jgi:hypothetical protein
VHRRLTFACVGLAVVAGGAVAIAGAVGGRANGVRVASATAVLAPQKLTPPRIPATGAYLGVDTNFVGGSTGDQVLAFEHNMGDPVGMASFYVAFLQIPPLDQMHAVLATGAVPMVNMKCGATDASVVAGEYDMKLRKLALDLKRFRGPVFFRWFWEMNLAKSGHHAACIGTRGASGYIQAYRHIWTIFHEVGANNVAFVWAPSDAAHVQHSSDLTYWPGAKYVDWIGADMYDRQTVHKTFGHEFDTFYRFWHAEAPSTPIMLSETGAVGAEQVTWLKQITADLTRKVHETRDTPYTQVKAVVYVNAIDKYNYILKYGTPGHQQFAAMLHMPYFDVRG